MLKKYLLPLILLILVYAMFVSTTAAMIPISYEKTQEIMIFKCLVIEDVASSKEKSGFIDGQYFIRALLDFPNFNNSTDKYISFINFWSYNNFTDLHPDVQRFYKGKPDYSKVYTGEHSKLLNETEDFFRKSGNPEISLLYYTGHGVNGSPLLGINATIIIVNRCWAEDWIFPALKDQMVLAACKNAQSSWCNPPGRAIFAGQKNATNMFNGYEGPLGIIGGMYAANDSDNDGWRSGKEIFEFANVSVQEYMALCRASGAYNMYQDPVIHNGYPTDIPLVLIEQVSKTTDIINTEESNGIIDIFDIVKVATAYGSYPGVARWSEIPDVDNDKMITLADLELIVDGFG